MTTATDLPTVEPEVVEPPAPTCDFCGDPSPSLSFPPRFGAVGLILTGPGGLQVDPEAQPWLSCDTCAPYVRRLDAQGLAHRVARILAAENPEAPDSARTHTKRVLADRYQRVMILLSPAVPYPTDEEPPA